MSTESNKQAVRKMFECQDKGDLAGERALHARDFVAYMAGNDRAMNEEEFQGMEQMFFTSFTNGRHIIDSQVAEGDLVMSYGSWSALHVKDFNGIPASHKPVKIESVTINRFVDGKIVEHRALVDIMTLMMQIGAVPQAA